jgi:Mg-chelatase subunit ChlD
MRNIFILLLATLFSTQMEANEFTAATQGELKIEIHTPAARTDMDSTDGAMFVEVEGAASTIGGVRFIDMMLVMDTSMSLRDNDPDDYRTIASVGLIEALSPKSDTNIGLIGFNDRARLIQPLTPDRGLVSHALKGLKRSGGTNLADGILTALEELERAGRPDSSRVIVLFTDGMSNEEAAREAARKAESHGVAVQTMLLGENLKGGFLLEEIAQTTRGSFAWVLDPSELPEAFLNLKTTGVDNVTLSVNGSAPIPAQLTGGFFTGTVPLAVGENRIVARATSLDEQTMESEVSVTVNDASCAALEVAALKEGLPALSLNERSVEIVVDASRSMWGQIDGKAKMTIAKEILHDASIWLPNDLDLALRAYVSTSASDANDCADSSLLVPFGSQDRNGIRTAVSGLRPLGQTPIAYALNQSAADFSALDGEKTIVLVTDGLESCGGDPVAAARDLRWQGITIHLIGFGMYNSADEDTASLRAIAEESGGYFLNANSAEELRKALEVTVGTPFRVFSEDELVGRGMLGTGEAMYLPTGDYRLELDSVPPHEVAFSLAARDELTLTLEKDGDGISHSENRDLIGATSCEDAIMATKRQQQPAFTSALNESQPERTWR